MPRGGARPGAGRKPKAQSGGGVVLGMDGVRIQGSESPAPPSPAPSDAELVDLLVPPSDLTKPQQRFWRTYAPLAVEQRTLTPSTVAGFRELCEQFALKHAITKRIEKVGPASSEGTNQMKTYVKLAQRVDATLARFKLTAFGKPADGKVRKPVANPWSQVAT